MKSKLKEFDEEYNTVKKEIELLIRAYNNLIEIQSCLSILEYFPQYQKKWNEVLFILGRYTNRRID